ncbi:type I addiction module toxin, SymE family [Dickeya undicola]|uniref:Type I addiction module toxin, SymE family n=1 Tax=Dickeya undicola TaxID=1577887 RepID=A0ABX9WQX3_9GAMM|nr:type I addiction module toxin, SymE family [Dickeya undicola]
MRHSIGHSQPSSKITTGALVTELNSSDTEGTDWISDNDELTLAGDWLTQSGLLTPPFSIEALPGRIILRSESGAMLA